MPHPIAPEPPLPPDDPSRASTVLSLRDLHFGYEPAQVVIDGVTSSLDAGRLGALIGPNAAGKSTLAKLMLGHLKPWQGEVMLSGRSVGSMDPMQRAASLSYVPQRGGVSFSFTVRQVVEMGRYAPGPDAAAVTEALQRCDLNQVQDRIFAHLSGGQQQRVLIARAIAQSRGAGRAMVLDEPGSSLDLHHLHHMMRILRGLADAGLAVLVILHDLNLAARYADEVWLLDKGRLVAAGPWDRVLQPTVLEPVYRVRLTPIDPPRCPHSPGAARPVFLVDTADTL